MIRGWELGTGQEIERGGFLYAPVYGKLASLIPNNVFNYGVTGDFQTHRKMSFINAFFGTLSSVVIFLIGYFFTKSIAVSFLIALFHSVCGFVFLCSINSEDVIAAYFFFVTALFFFFKNSDDLVHNHYNQKLSPNFFFTCFFASLVPFFHWTLLPPMLFGFLMGLLFLKKQNIIDYKYIGKTVLGFWAFIFIIFYISKFLLDGALDDYKFTKVVFSSKSDAAGWLGFRLEKVFFMLVGISNYVWGGGNVGSVNWGELLRIVYFIVLLVTSYSVFEFIRMYRSNSGTQIKVVAVCVLGIFITAQIMHFYAQPQDPQAQIQPMIIIILILATLAKIFWNSLGLRRKYFVFCGSILLIAVVLSHNIGNFVSSTKNVGRDSIHLKAINDFNQELPVTKYKYVAHGFDGWITWTYVTRYASNYSELRNDYFFLTEIFTANYGITSDMAFELTKSQIDRWIESGHRVVANVLWAGYMQPTNLISSLSSITSSQIAKNYVERIDSYYRPVGDVYPTAIGDFVEIVPK